MGQNHTVKTMAFHNSITAPLSNQLLYSIVETTMKNRPFGYEFKDEEK